MNSPIVFDVYTLNSDFEMLETLPGQRIRVGTQRRTPRRLAVRNFWSRMHWSEALAVTLLALPIVLALDCLCRKHG